MSAKKTKIHRHVRQTPHSIHNRISWKARARERSGVTKEDEIKTKKEKKSRAWNYVKTEKLSLEQKKEETFGDFFFFCNGQVGIVSITIRYNSTETFNWFRQKKDEAAHVFKLFPVSQ